MSNPIVTFDEDTIRSDIREIVRKTVEDTINALLDEDGMLHGLPCRVSVDGGLISVPEAISGACGIKANERLHVIGNSGYFEVWRKPAFDAVLSSFDILDVLLEGEGE